jgi:hypothetical protein
MSAWIDRSEQMNALATAWVKASGEMRDLVKTQKANVGQYAYTFATLADLNEMARPVLAAHGLLITQTAATVGDEVAISTTVLHSSGQFVTAQPLTLPVGKTAQATGSAITYARRYALMAMLGLATEDDDGAAAAPREAPRSAPERRNASQRTSTAPKQAAKPEPRSDAEREIRALLATLTGPEATRVRSEFKAAFGSTLAELDVDLHEPALIWMREAVEVMNAADAAWVAEAQS